MRRIGLLGVPSSAGARQKGQEKGPRALRKASLLEKMGTTGLDIHDFGDLPEVSYRPDSVNPRGQNLDLVVSVAKSVSDRVNGIVKEGFFPVVMGGDCTITLGVLDGVIPNKPGLGLIYFDGDVDINTPDTTVSGIFDGMGLAHIIGKGTEPLTHLGTRYPLMPEKNVLLFGYNEEAGLMDAWEKETLSTCQMMEYPVEKIRGKPRESAGRAAGELASKVDSILLHFDVDVIDDDDFPVADVPHPGGLTFDEAMEALSVFLSYQEVTGLVITEFNANRDVQGFQAGRLVEAVVNAFGTGTGNL
ncbi:MAG: arginase family protein [Fidelibacterota bacterium]